MHMSILYVHAPFAQIAKEKLIWRKMFEEQKLIFTSHNVKSSYCVLKIKFGESLAQEC